MRIEITASEGKENVFYTKCKGAEVASISFGTSLAVKFY